MEKIEILRKINESIKTLGDNEEEITMVEFALYQKKIEKLKKQKTEQYKQFLENGANIYNQNISNFKEKIQNNEKKYTEIIEKLIRAWDEFFVSVVKIRQEAFNKQKMAIANIISLEEELQRKERSEDVIKKANERMIAYAEQKINYSVMVNECSARIKWCTENVLKDINELFSNCQEITIKENKETFFYKILSKISNKFSGKNKYNNFLINNQKQCLEKIEKESLTKSQIAITTMFGVRKQMQLLEREIIKKFNERKNVMVNVTKEEVE